MHGRDDNPWDLIIDALQQEDPFDEDADCAPDRFEDDPWEPEPPQDEDRDDAWSQGAGLVAGAIGGALAGSFGGAAGAAAGAVLGGALGYLSDLDDDD